MKARLAFETVLLDGHGKPNTLKGKRKMIERYYAKDGKTYAIIEGKTSDDKIRFTVYYDGWFAKPETHEIKLYEWAKHLHGNAPSGTPYGYFRTNRGGKRIIITA